jgi:hypothetical protein
MEELKYPIGRFAAPEMTGPAEIREWILQLAAFPELLRNTVSGLTAQQLDTTYRPGGWTLRQVVHHLPDSHMNAYIRFKLAITEDNPEIRPYHEELWAETEEAKNGDISMSLDLLESLHNRWVAFLNTLSDEQFRRTYYHPQNQQTYSLDVVLALYAWHCKHHLGHISSTIRRQGWQ